MRKGYSKTRMARGRAFTELASNQYCFRGNDHVQEEENKIIISWLWPARADSAEIKTYPRRNEFPGHDPLLRHRTSEQGGSGEYEQKVREEQDEETKVHARKGGSRRPKTNARPLNEGVCNVFQDVFNEIGLPKIVLEKRV